MIPLQGAQLHQCVDIEGQAIASDLQSGRSEDRLAFGLSLVNSDNLYLRAAKPNERKQWVELLEKVRVARIIILADSDYVCCEWF